jgi:1-acyl-sn-glycerol-3-phosphate acyltransferase
LVILTSSFTVLFPVLMLVAVAVDVGIGLRRARTSRTVAFLTVFFWSEVRAVATATALWVRFRGHMSDPRAQAVLQRELSEYGHRIWTLSRQFFGVSLQVTGTEALRDGSPLICFAHHTSILDSVVPVEILGHGSGFDLGYVVKKELAWMPAIDLVGGWLPVHFVDRTGRQSNEEAGHIGRLVANIKPGSAQVLFPEGTFYTERRLERAVERMRLQDSSLVDRALGLRHVLPPRPGGALALLDAAPACDVVFIAHVGFEPYVNVKKIFAELPFRQPVEAHVWRISRQEIPYEPNERYRWLFGQFEVMDTWVGERIAARSIRRS